MELAMIGLGKMGLNMTKRLLGDGHKVVGYARSAASRHAAEEAGADSEDSLAKAVHKLRAPRTVWLMVPAGKATDDTVQQLSEMLEKGDTVIDGGNSNYKDSLRHAELLKEKGIHFLDVGTSGGVWGLKEGYSMMIGGDKRIVEQHRPIFETLAPGKDQGWGHVGSHGAGHFVKMVHNGIEYGIMQAYAEGFEILKAKHQFELKLADVAEIWRFGSVIRSWLLDLTANVLHEGQDLVDIEPWVADSGEGRWTSIEAIELDIPAPVITLALQARYASRHEGDYQSKLLAAMRNQFGGHAIKYDE
jgi:6-phosphogluconate dehydrogenase